jgi:IS5 family transposase
MKSDYRMQRNYLKGFNGDEINLLLAATAFNLKKWMNIYFYALFIQDFVLLLEAMKQIQMLKSLCQKLILLKLYF